MAVEVDFFTKDWNKDKWSQNVTIGTNDPDHPSFSLRIEGTVKPAITTLPADPSVSFGIVGNEEPSKRTIALYSTDRPGLVLTKVGSSNPGLLDVVATPMTPEQAAEINTIQGRSLEGDTAKVEKGYTIDVILKPTSNLGAFVEEVVIATDHPKKSELKSGWPAR